jgi:hypothetical protein
MLGVLDAVSGLSQLVVLPNLFLLAVWLGTKLRIGRSRLEVLSALLVLTNVII